MPRPQKPTADLTKIISIRLTEEEHSTYQKKVTESGLTASAFFRNCVLKNKTQVIAKPTLSPEQKHIFFTINRTTMHLNQLAQAANEAFLAGKVEEPTFQAILNNLEEVSHHLKEAFKYAN